MSIYSDLTDQELADKIVDLRARYETAVGGGAAIVVAGENRRLETTRADSSSLLALLNLAIRERDGRNGIQTSGAIGVSYPYE